MSHLLDVDIEVQEAASLSMIRHEAVSKCSLTPNRSSVSNGSTEDDFASKVESDDDELDPAMKEELDRLASLN